MVTHIVQEVLVQIRAVVNHKHRLISHKSPRQAKGFTLIELILYTAMVSVVILSTSAFLQLIFASRAKSQTIAEVEQQGLQAMQLITQTVRNSTLINSPTEGNNSSSLSLTVLDSTKNPTVFDLSSGQVRITEGASSAVNLTSSQVLASSLTFQNLSYTGTPNTIRIQFTLTYINPEGRNEYNFSKTIYGSANIRD